MKRIIKSDDIGFSVEYNQIRGLGVPDINIYVTTQNGKILLIDFRDTMGEPQEKVIGTVKVKIFHIDAMLNNRIDPFDVFDLEGSDSEIYANVFKNGYFKTSIDNYFGERYELNMCVIERIEIEPEFRGYGITKMISDDLLIQQDGHCRFIMLKAYPLQFEEGVDINDPSFEGLEKEDEKKASEKLYKFYHRIGFRTIPRIPKEFMFKGIRF